MPNDKTRAAYETSQLLRRLEAERAEFDILWRHTNLRGGFQERNRFRTIAMLAQGLPYQLICKELEISSSTLHNTKRRFLRLGARGLLTQCSGRGGTNDDKRSLVFVSSS